MTTAAEQKLMDVKFKLDMYYAAADTAENTLEKIQDVLNPNVKLMDNQQLVLEWLKKKYKTTDIEPIELIWRLRVNSNSDRWRLQPPYKNYRYLTEIAQFQVLAAFAEWGKEKVTE